MIRALESSPAPAPRAAMPSRAATGRSRACLLHVSVLRLTVAGMCGTSAQRTQTAQTHLVAAEAVRGQAGPLVSRQSQADYEQALNFGPAWPGDSLVFGARRPGWPDTVVNGSEVDRWLRMMQDTHGITQVLCLLGVKHLQMYEPHPELLTTVCLTEKTCEPELLRRYRAAFGANRVHWHSAVDFDIMSAEQLVEALSVLHESADANERILIHCSAGSGRTGQVLAAWRASHHGVLIDEALKRPFASLDGNETAVRRNPLEAVGKWSAHLQKEIEEHDLKGALNATLARLHWAQGDASLHSEL